MGFVIPKEEKWVKQVRVDDAEVINQWSRDVSNCKLIRGLNFLGVMNDKIVVVYEENVNAEENSEK